MMGRARRNPDVANHSSLGWQLKFHSFSGMHIGSKSLDSPRWALQCATFRELNLQMIPSLSNDIKNGDLQRQLPDPHDQDAWAIGTLVLSAI
jgi:hypothetical protein